MNRNETINEVLNVVMLIVFLCLLAILAVLPVDKIDRAKVLCEAHGGLKHIEYDAPNYHDVVCQNGFEYVDADLNKKPDLK